MNNVEYCIPVKYVNTKNIPHHPHYWSR